ncbi:DUF4292 domain-containing protein [Hymenobacter sp. H14-R3]|uniref:DUF4292 domain-containing protein n=1 Tax=Hymenobacter sp. H14-R3 TaxID=3046308 RepID=UPI0024BA7F68|nr:DUF4292 domain-containing protein [Hymenobacter sp. H14-R3]MDJ0365654.1 DUF4292 domain-containing protein [Hymenobacter sp. H14-R3]
MNKSALVLAALALASCHRVPSSSGKLGPGTSTAIVPVETPAGVKTANTNFPYLNGRGKVHFKRKDSDMSANFNLRIRRDSAIWLSGSLLGIEGVRALLTPDSVRVVNRLEKTYFAGDYAYLSQLLNVPVTYHQMQDILLGDYQPAPKGALPVVKTEGDNQAVTYPQAPLILEQLVSISTGRLQQLKVSESAAQRSLTVGYADFQVPIGTQLLFAFTTNVLGQQGGTESTSATLNYQKVEVGSGHLDFPFSIPKGYDKQTKVKK